MATKDKKTPVEETKAPEITKEVSELPVLVIRKKDDDVNCVELSPEGYERMQEELKNCAENKAETLRSVWLGYKVATSEEVKTYKAKSGLQTIFSNE